MLATHMNASPCNHMHGHVLGCLKLLHGPCCVFKLLCQQNDPLYLKTLVALFLEIYCAHAIVVGRKLLRVNQSNQANGSRNVNQSNQANRSRNVNQSNQANGSRNVNQSNQANGSRG